MDKEGAAEENWANIIVKQVRTRPVARVRSISNEVLVRADDGFGKLARVDVCAVQPFWVCDVIKDQPAVGRGGGMTNTEMTKAINPNITPDVSVAVKLRTIIAIKRAAYVVVLVRKVRLVLSHADCFPGFWSRRPKPAVKATRRKRAVVAPPNCIVA